MRELAVKLKREGKKSIEVADIVGHSKRQVNRWWAKAKLPGPMKLTNKKGRGRKSKLTAGDKAQITALMKGKVGRSHRKVAKLLNNSDRNKQSVRMSVVNGSEIIFGDDTPGSKKKRERIIWTDESWIEHFPQPNKQNECVRVEDIEDVPTGAL